MAEEKKPPAAKPAAAPKPPAVMESVAWDDELTAAIRHHFGTRAGEFLSYREQKFIAADAEAAIPLLAYLKLEAGFDYLVDLTAVHWPKREKAEFDLIYVVYSFSRNERVRVKAKLADGAVAESATGVHLTANWLEREVYDLFGIRFAHHPDLRRILMPDDWDGHPLRKDYGIIQMDQRWVRENLGIESGQ